MGSTCVALARGGVEGNPLLPGTCKEQIMVQAPFTSVAVVGVATLFPNHPKVAKVIASIAVGSGTIGFVVNVRR